MSSSLPKILETGINVFISNSQIITIKTYYEKYKILKGSHSNLPHTDSLIKSSKRNKR